MCNYYYDLLKKLQSKSNNSSKLTNSRIKNINSESIHKPDMIHYKELITAMTLFNNETKDSRCTLSSL